MKLTAVVPSTGGGEVQGGDAWNEWIALRRHREDVGNIVALIAPGIHIDRRVEDSVGNMSQPVRAREALRKADPRRKVGVVGIHQASRISVLPADEDLRRSAAQVEIAVGVGDVDERAHEFIAKAVGEGSGRGQPPRILRVSRSAYHWRRFICGTPSLTLPRGGQP